jgi:polyhydroxyalkanoate depolymerase
MLYTTFEAQRLVGLPAVKGAHTAARLLDALPPGLRRRPSVRRMHAVGTLVSRARPTFVRPAFGIETISVAGRVTTVGEDVVYRRTFASLMHFAKAGVTGQPRVLVVGPMSGHFTTLIAPTIRTLLQDHDVFVLDWHNARDIPVRLGGFGFDDFVAHVVEALRHLGPAVHVVSVCQPAPAVLAAVSLLAAENDPAEPISMTLIAGPIDTRIAPGRVNQAAVDRPLSWYEKRFITKVPSWYAGAGRRVYPGFVQLAAFMSMNPMRHWRAHAQLYRDLVAGNSERAKATTAFYDEYGSVMDVPAEFYLETVDRVFQRHLLPRDLLMVHGRHVDPGVISRCSLLTVEGENDDICPAGQTAAAHPLCPAIPPSRRRHHLQAGVGHYGVFSGSRWEREIYPVVREAIAAAEHANAAVGID